MEMEMEAPMMKEEAAPRMKMKAAMEESAGRRDRTATEDPGEQEQDFAAASSEAGGDYAEAAAAEDPRVLARKYAVAMGKMMAGVCRFLFEDILQSFAQSIWLCKQWKHVSLYTKAFTLCSIGSGLFLSFAVPLKEAYQIRKMRQRAGKDGDQLTITAADEPEQTYEPLMSAPMIAPQAGGKAGVSNQPRSLYPAKITVSKFLSSADGHGKKAHLAMVASACAFWGYMASYPKIFGDQISCDGAPPGAGLQIFFGLFVFDVVLQVWVLVHTQNGYNMVVDNLRSFAEGVLFSLLGRFDTYADVSFSYKLFDCDPITWFSIKGNVFPLPFPLVYFAIFALVFGVLCMQALPGLVFLCRKTNLPMAMKFNEFNLILTVMSEETPDDEGEQQYDREY